jgi:hypothetical protein
MHEKQIVTAILTGCVLIAFGLIPGLLSGIKEGIQNFRAELFGLPTIAPRHGDYPQWLPGQIGFAWAGVALILIGLLGYLTR